MMRKSFAGFDVADFRSRWIQYFFQNAGFWPLPGQNVVLVFIQMSVPR